MNVALLYLLNTIALPIAVTAATAWVARQRGLSGSDLLALTLGFIASYTGVFELSGLWGTDATRWVIWGALIMGGLTAITPRALRGVSSVFGVSLALYLCLSPLAGMWREGIVKPLVTEWVLGAWLLICLVCLVVVLTSQPEQAVAGEDETELSLSGVSPAHFASLALCYAIAAPCVGLSGSASLAQLLGALGLSTASVGVLGLRRGAQLSLSAYLCAYAALALTLVSAHFYLTPGFPSAIASLIIITPATVTLTARWRGAQFKRVLMSLLVSAPLLSLALALTASHELAKAEAEAEEVDEFGASY